MRILGVILQALLLFFLLTVTPAVFAQTDKCIREIRLTGNKQTKASIILREMTVGEGDCLSDERLAAELQKSKDNLLNTSLFNYVYLIPEPADSDSTAITIMLKVEERWYIWPILELKLEDRNMSAWLKDPSWEKVTFTGGLAVNNVRGRKENMKFMGRWGYAHAASFSYQNIALDKRQTHFLGAFFNYENYHDVAYATENNEVLYIHSNNGALYEKYNVYFSHTYRPKVREYHVLNMGFSSVNIGDTILILNPDYWGGNRLRRNFMQLDYVYRADYRDSYVYPLKGYMFSIKAETEVTLNDGRYVAALYPEYQRHLRLAERWGYAFYAASKLSVMNANSYIHNHSLGYFNKLLRGYEYYVMDGQHYALVQNNFKFTLLPTKIVTLNFLSALSKFNKIHFTFYLNAFFDMGYVYNRYKAPDNSFQNSFLYSGGLGLDLVTYYDITLRLDYAVNKLGEGGFYFHITAPFI